MTSAPSGSTFNLGMFAPTGGLPVTGGARRTADTPPPQTAATRSVVTTC